MQATKRELLERAGNPEYSRMVENNTLEYLNKDGATCYLLHETVIARIRRGRITLNSGGYRTMLTKDRLNGILGGLGLPTLYSDKGAWYFGDWKTKPSLPYYDGMSFPVRTGPKPSKEGKERERRERALRKRIGAWVKRHTAPGVTIPMPDGGDCWYCAGFDPDGTRKDHIRNHLREDYFHGSLIFLAFKVAGYNPQGFMYHLERAANGEKWARERVAHSVRRLMLKAHGLSC